MSSQNDTPVAKTNKRETQLTPAERHYWQQRMPNGFQFYLERLARAIIRNQPSDIAMFAAAYLEELLVSRNAALWCLPRVSYFSRLSVKRSGQASWTPRRVAKQHFSQKLTHAVPATQTIFPDTVPTEGLPQMSMITS